MSNERYFETDVKLGKIGHGRNLGAGMLTAVLIVSTACAPVSRLPKVDESLAALEAEKQRSMALEETRARTKRLNEIGYRILHANADLCKENTVRRTGSYFGNKYSFPEEFRTAAREVYGADEVLRFIDVVKGSPADLAGIKERDAIVSFNGWSVPAGSTAVSRTGSKLKDLNEKHSIFNVVVLRGHERKSFSLLPEKICNYSVKLVDGEQVNAFADGKSMMITTGMMRFVETDEQLATVMSHEVAHNLMAHMNKKRGNAVGGLLVDLLLLGAGVNTQGAFSRVAGQAYSQEFEAEADYVGLYLMARAGYDIDKSPNFWRKMGIAHPGSIKTNHGATHPSTPARFIALEKTVQEIKAKRTANQPLEPELAKPPENTTPEPENKSDVVGG